LLLAGAKDFALSPGGLTGADTHADELDVRVIGGAGHYLPEEQPGIVAAAIREMARR
jgi:pimeloyl-ACP methyl ester carboxylesterase